MAIYTKQQEVQSGFFKRYQGKKLATNYTSFFSSNGGINPKIEVGEMHFDGAPGGGFHSTARILPFSASKSPKQSDTHK